MLKTLISTDFYVLTDIKNKKFNKTNLGTSCSSNEISIFKFQKIV